MSAEFIPSALLRRIHVCRDFLPVLFIVVRQNVRIRHANGFYPKNARHLLLVGKIRISEFLEPCEVVEYGMVDAIWTAGTHVAGRHSQMLQKSRVVGTAAQISDRHVAFYLCYWSSSAISDRFGWRLRGRRVWLRSFLPLFVDRPAFRPGHNLRPVTQERLPPGNG